MAAKKQTTAAIKKNILKALEKHLGVVTTACKAAGCSRAVFYNYYNKDEKFKSAVNDISEVAIDFAESKLLKNIDGGDTTATIFYLKTKGKHRGYVERQEVVQADATMADLLKSNK